MAAEVEMLLDLMPDGRYRTSFISDEETATMAFMLLMSSFSDESSVEVLGGDPVKLDEMDITP
jgi:hypothetical protein